MWKNTKELTSSMLNYIRLIRFPCKLSCPHCNGSTIIKNGKYKERQRYICKDCGKTFSDLTCTPFYMTHFPDKWPSFIECMLKGLPLRKSAEIVGVSYVTLFYWRHKLLSYLELNKPTEMDGIIEADDLYFAVSHKGKRHINKRKPRARGIQFPYINRDRVCVAVAADHHNNFALSQPSMFVIHRQDIEAAIGNFIKKDTILCTTNLPVYYYFCKFRHVMQYRMDDVYSTELFNINIVKKYINCMKTWFLRFKGVSTRYLNNYVMWYKFLHDINFDDTMVGSKLMLHIIIGNN